MKASMSATGMLVIVPKSGIEAYAITHWAKENLSGVQLQLILDCSNFHEMIEVHASDCAVHNEPAYPNGPCDCGAKE